MLCHLALEPKASPAHMSHPRTSALGVFVLCVLAGGCDKPKKPKPPRGVPDEVTVEIPADDPHCSGVTDFPGDCLVLDPPVPGEGYQAHYGPTDYDDPDEVNAFVIQPRDESIDCAYSVLDNEDTVYFQRHTVASRTGMHHVILYALPPGAAADGTRDRCQLKNQGGRVLGVLHGGVAGSVFEYPPSGQIAEENVGLGTALEAEQVIGFELHAVNPQDTPLLRESWVNFYTMPEESVTETAGQVIFNGGLGMKIPPQTSEVVTNTCSAPGSEVRLLEIFGHMHAHGVRFSAFKTTPDPLAPSGEQRALIYESYDWSELDRREFNSAVQNPAPEYRSGRDSAHSGILTFAPGDRLDYECEVVNTTDYDLVYSLGAYTAEMCNLFGAYAPDLGWPWVCLGN
jgi:hypothetical protein